MALDVTAYAKACRILAQALQEIGGTLQDAATDLELLAPDDEPDLDACTACGGLIGATGVRFHAHCAFHSAGHP